MKHKCQNCKETFVNISNHWEQSQSCSFPKLSSYQKNIITGVLMGDGCISKPGKNPQLIVEMINKEYLQWLSSMLSPYGNKIKMSKTAKESAQRNRERGFRPNASEKNYNDLYRLNTRTSPELTEFYHWYSSGEKRFPENISLTPATLKNWYVCDGTYNTHGGANRIQIYAQNEKERFSNITSMFNRIGLNAKTTGKTIYFSNSETTNVFEYMGEPLPGFERKWPDNYGNPKSHSKEPTSGTT